MTQICKVPRSQWCSYRQILKQKLCIRVTGIIPLPTVVKTEFMHYFIDFKG